jgi:hypothetical protein
MRSDHLAKHTKTHENKVKKMIAKKGEKLEKQSKALPATSVVVKQEKVEDEDIKPSIFPMDTANNSSFMDMSKIGNGYNDNNSASSQNKPLIDDYYSSYHHPYQYHQSNMYAFHQNSRFYQDKNYFYGHMVGEQSRGMFTSNSSTPQMPTENACQPMNQNGFYNQSSSSNSHEQNYILNFNAPVSNTININTSNLMININNTTTNTSNNNTNYQAHHEH